MKLRILWVRHSPIAPGRVNRDSFLLPRLSRWHEVQLVTWNNRETVSSPWQMLRPHHAITDGIETWVLPRLPRPPGWPPWKPSINQPMFRAALWWLERRLRPDVVVVGPSWAQIGLPPALRAVRVFDYLDGSDWSDERWRSAEAAYLEWSDGVVAVSGALSERAQAWPRPCALVENGVELETLLGLRNRRTEIRHELGLAAPTRVVSLIGLTAAADRYWVRAIGELLARDPATVFAAVGGGVLAAEMGRLASELGERFRWVGPVPYSDAQRWFVASDVTWYPGADIEYFHLASPLKVYEGLAAGAQVVVAPRLRSLQALDLPSLHFVAPNTDALVRGTLHALRMSEPPSHVLRERLAAHSWDSLSATMSEFLEQLVSRRRSRSRECLT